MDAWGEAQQREANLRSYQWPEGSGSWVLDDFTARMMQVGLRVLEAKETSR
jgi:hypothetical protein